tara:strand:+ start:2372 stop:5116 length:2745 start_codon:yes stop_codon:yes gene_type:complete
MAQIDLGKLKFQWKGNYADSTAYEVDDVVFDKGSTWIVVTAVANSNTTDPEANNKFERMSSGYNYRAAYNNSYTYYLNDLVLESNNIYRYINNTPSSGNAVSNGTYWAVFIPNAAGNSLSQPGDLLVQNKLNAASRLGLGTHHSYLISEIDPVEDFPTHEKVDYSINTTGSNTAILTDQSGNNVGGGGDAANASITLSRGRRYYFQVPTGATYSFKDSNAGGYSNSGAGGRIQPCNAGVGTNVITGGGVLQFHPNTDVVGFPTTGIVLRNEGGGTDQVSITLEPLRFTPQWRRNYKTTNGDTDFKDRGFSDHSHFANSAYNYHTVGVGTNYYTPQFLKKYGAGNNCGSNPKSGIYRGGVFIDKTKTEQMWGNFYHDGSNNYYYWHGMGERDMQNQSPTPYTVRMPNWMQAAIEGNSDYAKFLTDIHGNDLNLQPSDNLPIIESQTSHQGQMTLSANGILFFTGYNNYGYSGNGQTRNYGYPVPVSFYDTDRSTALTGANRPKVKMYHWSLTKSDTNTTYGSVYAVDTEGFLYTCGYNAYKQLRTGNTTNSQYLSRIPKSFFGNRPIVFVTSSSCQYTAAYAITDDGRCWSWGQNDNGQLANDNETDQDTPVDITSVSGSPLNGKRIRHVMGSDGNSNVTRVWFLTTDGEVFTCGQNESYGNYTGAITSNSSTDLDLPTALTDAATTINSDGQKVVAMYTTGGRYCTSWFITDGGNSGESASKVYACGNNNQGEMGTGSATAHGSASGNWRLKEIEFDSGPADTFTTAATDSVTGTRSTFLSGGSNQNRMKIGRIVKVQGHGWGSNTGIPVSALDEFGQMWIAGEWNMIYSKYYNRDDDEDFQGSNDYTTRFIKMYSQPEPFIDFCFYNRNTESEVAMMAIGESGQLYVTGYGGWNNLGNEVDYTMDNWTVPHKL